MFVLTFPLPLLVTSPNRKTSTPEHTTYFFVFPPDIKVASLHGKMKAKEKNAVMEAFAAGEIQVLVSTTVVEVGVNVPNATVMMVENAERFACY